MDINISEIKLEAKLIMAKFSADYKSDKSPVRLIHEHEKDIQRLNEILDLVKETSDKLSNSSKSVSFNSSFGSSQTSPIEVSRTEPRKIKKKKSKRRKVTLNDTHNFSYFDEDAIQPYFDVSFPSPGDFKKL
ncbi:unnamed protein product [Moneuplotes crassus]|uniref:Uncharacterized protein n=1 Tax=Euplotes crassus TaxID=5936 RepID=A0AAD1Y1Z0_EUPCR|nr:unnamed protein product [Moneuplotes crassus]